MNTSKAPLPTEPTPAPRRYSGISIALHWLIALLIFVQLGLGWYLNEVLPDHSPAQDRAEAIHIEIGLTLLLFVLVRIAARLANPAPRLPARIAGWERRLAQAVHYLLYALMLIVPLSGWALLTSRAAPISFWGLPWPRLPGVAALAGSDPHPLRATLKTLHIWWMAWAVVIALALHVAGAIKHQFDGHPVLWRMVPFLKKPSGEREAEG
jgi:cytochrome b561